MANIDSSGFKYRMDSLGMDQDSLLAAFDFTNNPALNGGYINPAYWAKSGSYSGKLNGSSSSFFQKPGSGYFLGSNSLDVLGNIPSDNFSFLFCYERVGSGSQVLLSSSTGSNFSSSSGITLGINDYNGLYFEYWNPVDGIFSFSFPYEIASKNIVYLNKGFQKFNLGVFNPSNSSLNFYSFPIYNSSYAHSDKFRIAGGYSNYWSSGNGFNGYFDDFYCLSGSFPEDYVPALCSGFYSSLVSGSLSGIAYVCENVTTLTGSGVILGTGITGYSTTVSYSTGYVPTGYYNSGYKYPVGTGVTGYENKYIGDIEDACGFFNPVYVLNPLTGTIYASGFSGVYTGITQVITPTYSTSPLTGYITGNVFVPVDVQQCSNKDIYYPVRLEVDSGFIYSLGFDSVYRFGSCSDFATGEVCAYTEQDKVSINNIPIYDTNLSEFYVSDSYSGQNVNLVFKNGRLLLESGYSFYNDGYDLKYNLTGDIFFSGKNIMSNKVNKKTDAMLYDFSTGLQRSARLVSSAVSPGSNLSSYFSPPYTNISLFLNGKKLISGAEFNSSTINIPIPASSVLIKVSEEYISSKKERKINTNNLVSGFNKFLPGNLQVYYSGLRLSPLSGYIEVSDFRMISGCSVASSSNLFYSSSDNELFWNG
jgi:hypothetical protein